MNDKVIFGLSIMLWAYARYATNECFEVYSIIIGNVFEKSKVSKNGHFHTDT